MTFSVHPDHQPMDASDAVSSGTAMIEGGGDASAPSHVNRFGMNPSSSNAGMMKPCGDMSWFVEMVNKWY
jgi:hypothetical protein